jgi:peptidoglycan/LPS O-acetylase OafA/YrhL
MTHPNYPKLNGPWILDDHGYEKSSVWPNVIAGIAAAVIIGILAYFMVDAWITEDVNRVEHLRIHKQGQIERSIQ